MPRAPASSPRSRPWPSGSSPRRLFDEFVAFRESIGLRIFPLTGSGDVFRGLVRAARGGAGLIPLLADRDLTNSGVEVDLFGARARFAAGPAALAVSTGAPLVTTVISYERLTGARRKAAGSPWGIVIQFNPSIPCRRTCRARIRCAR